MTIADLLVKEGKWPDKHGPWGRRASGRLYSAQSMTIRDLYEVCHRLGIKVKISTEEVTT